MTQEQKGLLLKNLCARLPYGVMCNIGLNHPFQLQQIFVDRIDGILLDFYEDGYNYQVYLSEVKPYLFPLSSMTEEHIFEINDILGEDFEIDKYGITDLIRNRRTSLSYLELDTLFEYFNKNHFDYRDLIEKGLAIDATGLNIY